MSILRRHNRLRRLASFLALFAMMLQAAFAVAHASTMQRHLLSDDFGQGVSGVIVVCTPAGLKALRLGEQDTGDAPLSHSPEDICPVCVTFAAQSTVLGDVPLLVHPVVRAELGTFWHYDLPSGQRTRHQHSRGPPAHA